MTNSVPASVVARLYAVHADADSLKVAAALLEVLVALSGSDAGLLGWAGKDGLVIAAAEGNIQNLAEGGPAAQILQEAMSSGASRFESLAGAGSFMVLTWLIDDVPHVMILGSAGKNEVLSSLHEQRDTLKDYVVRLFSASQALRQLEIERLATTALEVQLEDTQAAIDAAHDIGRTGNYRFNLKKHTNWWSPEVYGFYGFDPKEVTLTLEMFQSRLHPDDRLAIWEIISKATRERRGCVMRYRTLHPDGQIRHVLSICRPESVVDDGEFIGINIDVTERHNAIAAVRQAQLDLARASRLTTIGQLSASLTHELSQPLAALVGNAAAAVRWLDRDPPALDLAKESLAAIISSRSRASEVVGSLRDLARKSELNFTEIHVRDALKDISSLAQNEADRRGIALFIKVDPGDSRVLGDRIQLQQLLLSLILSGLQVTSTNQQPVREVTVLCTGGPDGRVNVEVSYPRANDEAENGPNDTGTTADANQIDLWLCQIIAESHGGRLAATSDAGRRGFTVSLPASSAALDPNYVAKWQRSATLHPPAPR